MPAYRPSSVAASDQQALASHMLVHGKPTEGRTCLEVLDSTYNTGKFWRHLPAWCPAFELWSMDFDPKYDVAVSHIEHRQGDFLHLQEIWAQCTFDVLVWDPPQVPDAGSGIVGDASWAAEYGTKADGLKGVLDLSAWFFPFLLGARYVLRPTGIIIAKLSDPVHGGTYPWNGDKFRAAAHALGMQPCDVIIKTRGGGQMADPRWQNVLHTKRMHSEFICVRVDGKC